jgi:antitoxin component of MazEF toxin-antitoxin module
MEKMLNMFISKSVELRHGNASELVVSLVRAREHLRKATAMLRQEDNSLEKAFERHLAATLWQG